MSDAVGRENEADTPRVVTRLRDAHEARQAARDAVEAVGRDRLGALRTVLDETHRLFDRYEGRATGTGDFEAYVSFQDDLVAFVEDLPNDLPEREVFEGWLDDFKKRTLSTSDFERARDELADARDLVARLDALEEAVDDHRKAVKAAKERRTELGARIEHLERVRELGDADLDAPVEDLRDPIESYNDTVTTDFRAFRRNATAREVLGFLDRAQAFPLVDVDAPPRELKSYVDEHEVGTESVSRMLELADFTRSKLEHFVYDPASFKRVVGGNRTYLDTLTADPFTIAWPPARADVLRRRIGERISLAGRFASEAAIRDLRSIQQRTREDRFGTLRDAAIARYELTESDRERLRSGAVADDLAAARDALTAVADALDEYA